MEWIEISDGKKSRMIGCLCMGVLAALLLGALMEQPVRASEGGYSSFTPGAQGDFAMCFLPPGLHVKNSIVYTEGELSGYPAGTTPVPGVGTLNVEAELESKVWFDLLQIVYSSETGILGGRYFANINIPIGISSKLNADATLPAYPAAGVVVEEDCRASGLGDIQVVPFGILWDFGRLHFLAAQNFVLPSGRYDPDKKNNMGRNYFSYDELFGVTWLDEEHGQDISVLAGYMINTRNHDTDYKTGNEFHADVTLAQHFSKQFGLGIVGYYYKQLTDDDSPELDEMNGNAIDLALGLPTPGGYKSEGAAVGPAVIFTPNIGGRDVHLIAKWLHEFDTENRLEGEWVWLSACVKF